MKLLRRLIDRYPYRGLFGWATACVWGFVIAETLWHLSAYVRNYDILEIPLVVPYAPLAAILDPHDAMIPDKNIFFFALANWLVIFLIGAAVSDLACSLGDCLGPGLCVLAHTSAHIHGIVWEHHTRFRGEISRVSPECDRVLARKFEGVL